MIIRRQDRSTSSRTGSGEPIEVTSFSNPGGLSQMGIHLHTLAAGAVSSDRHWHLQSEEFMLLLSGEVTLKDDDGEHLLQAGDAVCWPAGMANAHQLRNHADAPCTYLIVGTRPERDITRYPDSGKVLVDEPGRWHIENAAGEVLKSGVKSPR